LSRLLENGRDFEQAIASEGGVFVLFYAAWCPFCQRFLPVFEDFSRRRGDGFFRMEREGHISLFDAYGVQVYPTVLFFRSGKVVLRLDGVSGRGLEPRQLSDLFESATSTA
jgi:thioredoxin 1